MSCCPFWPRRATDADKASRDDLKRALVSAPEIDAMERGDWAEFRHIQAQRDGAVAENNRREQVIGWHVLGVVVLIFSILFGIALYHGGRDSMTRDDVRYEDFKFSRSMFCMQAQNYAHEHPDQQMLSPDVLERCIPVVNEFKAQGEDYKLKTLANGLREFDRNRPEHMGDHH